MTIRVAFIGAGQRSVSHMAALTHIADVQVVALADLDTNRAEAAQAKANERRAANSAPISATVFADYRKMLDQTTPDAVYLCLPPFVHGQLDHDLIDYGKPIFFEKPVALDMTVANEITDHLRQRNLINAAGYQKRYSSAVRTPKAMLEGQPIGMAIAIRLSGLPGTPWWRVQDKSGGMLTEQHTHAVDLMRFLCGEIGSVYAVGSNQLSQDVPNLDIFDMNACTVRFANGAPGIIGNSCAAPAGAALYPPHRVQVVTAGMVLNVNESRSEIHRVGQPLEEILPDADDGDLMNRAFIEAIRNNDQSLILSDFADAARTLAVTLACQRSAETGEPVTL
ncbi:MAG: Gfo/Idh/MocA family oxidoreductase [Caldilineaceae bacterium]|nr:Gfo/Idh/MocA family oxidoreductase [Caldilineaceae bacterium]